MAFLAWVCANQLCVCELYAQEPVLSDPKPTTAGDSTLIEIQGLLDAGKLNEGESALKRYLADNELSATAHEMLGYVLLRENKPAESLKEYTRAASTEKPTASILEHGGTGLRVAG